MIESIGTNLGIWLYHKGKIKENQIDMIRYAFEIMCSEFTEIIVILIYSMITKQVFQTIIYLVFFQILRQYFQGYHAKTILRCLLLTIGTYLIAMSVYHSIPFGLFCILLLVSAVMQIEYAVRTKQLKPIIISFMLHCITFFATALLRNFQFLQLLVVVDLIVSISLIPERRENV